MSAMTLVRLASCVVIMLLLCMVGIAPSQQQQGKKYALLVGVTKYTSRNFSELNFSDNDAEKMEPALKKAGFASVRVLTNKRGDKNKNDVPTTANIKSALKELLAKRTRHDTVLVGLAGHGIQLEVSDPDGKGPTKHYSYFCPSDASLQDISYSTGKSDQLLLLDDLFDQLGKCDAGHRLALIDACRNNLATQATKRRIDIGKAIIPDGVGVLFSCSRGQFAFETKNLKHGVFFHHVIEGLEGEAADKEGVVTWDNLASYVKRQVPRTVEKQFGKEGGKQVPASMGNLEGESVLARFDRNVVTELKKAHIMVIADDKDPSLQTLIDRSVKDLDSCIKAQLGNAQLELRILRASEQRTEVLTPEVVLKAVRDIKATKDESICCFYLGHGGMLDKDYVLDLRGVRRVETPKDYILKRADLFSELEAKPCRLKVLLTDASANKLDFPEEEEESSNSIKGPTTYATTDILASLLLRHEGKVNINSADAKSGQLSFYTPDDGGLFTAAFLTITQKNEKGYTWEQAGKDLKTHTNSKYRDLRDYILNSARKPAEKAPFRNQETQDPQVYVNDAKPIASAKK